MTEQAPLKTNHNARIVTLVTGERVLCLFGEVRNEKDESQVVGYRLIYPFVLNLGKPNEDGTIPITYTRWCPFSPVEEHRMSGEHIISVVFPDNNIVDNYVERLTDLGLDKNQIFFPEEAPEDGDNSEPAETGE